MKAQRQSVFIFPEGTRSYAAGPEMGAFKKGAFHLAVKAGVEIVPVVAGNYWGVLSVREKRFRAGRIPVKGEFLRSFLEGGALLSTTYVLTCVAFGELNTMKGRRIADLDMVVLPPIPTAHLTAADVEELTRTTREKMLKELVALTESPMGQKAAKADA